MEEYTAAEIAAWREQLMGLLGSDAQHYPKRIEATFPRILGKIVSLWGKPDLDAYLDGLMVSDRPGRQGFPGDVAMEIFHLSTIHAGLHLSDEATGTGWAGIQDPELYRKALKKE
ncbi:hypothetical protein LZ012_08970 [Dechloromonas sp. XY25]|uniref:Uncharacterized protein n=1 Tax=Dechloromonas hankyongensis TaxID=2908002 RepID=A0ABS9K1S0_9RHOO|nr:hypothetical protein [Dechloromonas hankyongensis]MCG2577129.1 hypothetical protein [Dechloromonas hankyongensis]